MYGAHLQFVIMLSRLFLQLCKLIIAVEKLVLFLSLLETVVLMLFFADAKAKEFVSLADYHSSPFAILSLVHSRMCVDGITNGRIM